MSATSSPFPMAKTLEEFAQLEPLWDKAIQSPAEISLEDKHRMMEWPPRAEMEATTQKALGISVDELIQKAATTPESLTYPECVLMNDNFRMLGYWDRGDRWKFPLKRRDLVTKKKQAGEAVLPSPEREAIRNLNKVFLKKELTELRLRQAKQEPRAYDMPLEWIQRILGKGDDKSWGFAFYHHKDIAGWKEFLEIFNSMLDIRFYIEGAEEIKKFKVAQFIPFETAENDIGYLQQDFLSRRKEGDLRTGILKNVFFLITDDARQSFATYGDEEFVGYFWAIDPKWSSSGPDEDGYDGRLKINAGQVFWRFYEFMSNPDPPFSLKDIWRDFHAVNAQKSYPQCFSEPPAWHFTNLDKPAWPFN